MNLLMCAKSSNDKTKQKMSYDMCRLLLTPTATATEPPPANFLTVHSRLVCQEKQREKN